MITLNSFQQEFIERNRNQSDFKTIKNVIKTLRDNGLDTPKLNSKKDILMTFWDTLLQSSACYQATNTTIDETVKKPLFNNQLSNIGKRSQQALLSKLI